MTRRKTQNRSHFIGLCKKDYENQSRLGHKFKCSICGNNDPRFIGIRNGKQYCRKCISFRGQEVTGDYIQSDSADYELHYRLSDDQKRLSKQLVENYKNGVDSLVHAVCGSGKTEIVLEVIRYAIEHKQKVGFAVPRRDVIRELSFRFRSIFEKNKICTIYGGHVRRLKADFICLTTHQLFRYDKYFDLLILDEIDAFPYNGNEVLEAFFKRAIKGHYILMSATPPESVVKEFNKKGKSILQLNRRFHGYPLPVPEVKLCRGIMKYVHLMKVLRRFLLENKPVFVFTPTIDECEQTYNVLRFLFNSINYVHSKKEDRSQVIDDFRKGKYQILVTTAVLERGVTIKNLQVVIFNADHPIYSSHALIQISGRVGRKKDAPTGEVIFIANNKTNDIVAAIREIEAANKDL